MVQIVEPWSCSIVASYYPFHGGASNSGAICGVFFINTLGAASFAGWGTGAALLLLHIMLDVVVIRPIGIFVGCFVFVRALFPVTIFGTLALLYHFLIV